MSQIHRIFIPSFNIFLVYALLLAPLKRLSPVYLPSANGFDKPFAASKFGKTNTENQTVDWSHYAKS